MLLSALEHAEGLLHLVMLAAHARTNSFVPHQTALWLNVCSQHVSDCMQCWLDDII